MIEQSHDPEKRDEASQNDAPDSEQGHREKERRKKLQHTHHAIKLPRMPPLTKPRANIAGSREINRSIDCKDHGQAAGEKMRKAVCPHGRLLSNRDRKVAQDIG